MWFLLHVAGIDVMKKWNKGHNEYFSHLEHVARLPEVRIAINHIIFYQNASSLLYFLLLVVYIQAYESFLLEIVRRRAFNKVNIIKFIVLSLSSNILTFAW